MTQIACSPLHAARLSAALASFALLGGCVPTAIKSFVDPEFRGSTFERLLVVGQYPHLDETAAAESDFGRDLARHGVTALRGLDLMPPTRTFDQDQVFRIAREQRVQGVLLVRRTSIHEREVWVPPGAMDEWSSPGYYASYLNVRHRLELRDVETGKLAWVASTLTRGTAADEYARVISSLAQAAVRQLAQDGLIPPRQKQ